MSPLAIALLLVLAAIIFCCGWQCCLWNLRRPRKRAICDTAMADRRRAISEAQDESFWLGFELGKAIGPQDRRRN